MKRYISLLLLALMTSICAVKASEPLKREFRGAWIQAVNGQFIGLSTSEMQATLSTQLDALQRAGINAIIFQVHASRIERIMCTGIITGIVGISSQLQTLRGRNIHTRHSCFKHNLHLFLFQFMLFLYHFLVKNK